MMEEKLFFNDIIDTDKWQKIQGHFSEVLGMTLVTLDKNTKFITRASQPCRLCNEVLAASPKALAQCRMCLPHKLSETEKTWKDGLVCFLGLYNFFIPIKVDDAAIAYLWAGPVILGQRPDNDHCRLQAQDLGIEPQVFCDTLREIKVFTFYGIKSVIEFLREISSYIFQLEYQNLRLERRRAGFTTMIEKIYKFYEEKLLGSLLDVAFNSVGAARGSLMLFDEQSNQLYIKSARGIPRDVVENTRLRLGEGIAGIVASEKEPLLIDETMCDERIMCRMHKPQIKSSFAVPIEVNKKLLGVLNLATLKPSGVNISSNEAATINSLIKLIESILSNLPGSEFR